MTLDPRTAHEIDARILLTLLPDVDQADLPEIRREFAQYLARPRQDPFDSWAEAWNLWTGAALNRPGQVTYTPARCGTCGGKGWSFSSISRNLGATGNPLVCHACKGSPHGQRTTVTARYAPPPVDPKESR